MSTQPWRGTLIFAGTLAAIAATAAARFSGSEAASTLASPTSSSPASTSSGSVRDSADAPSAATSAASSGASSTPSSAGAAGTQVGTPSATKTLVGTTVQTRYGPVQVAVTFTAGKIATVQALQTPTGHGESVRINSYAVPVLNKEAVAANSANIDTVSGATFTSQAYAQSLQSAIDKLG